MIYWTYFQSITTKIDTKKCTRKDVLIHTYTVIRPLVCFLIFLYIVHEGYGGLFGNFPSLRTTSSTRCGSAIETLVTGPNFSLKIGPYISWNLRCKKDIIWNFICQGICWSERMNICLTPIQRTNLIRVYIFDEIFAVKKDTIWQCIYIYIYAKVFVRSILKYANLFSYWEYISTTVESTISTLSKMQNLWIIMC